MQFGMTRIISLAAPLAEHALGDDEQLPARGPEVTQVGARVAVEQVDHGIAPRAVCGVARRQIDRDLRLGGLAHQVAFESLAVHLHALQRALERRRRRRHRAGARGRCRLASASGAAQG